MTQNIGPAACSPVVLPCASYSMRVHRAGPPACNKHTGGNPARRDATFSQIALAAYRVTLVGAAETGAEVRQYLLDPLWNREVGRHGHGSCGNADQPGPRGQR